MPKLNGNQTAHHTFYCHALLNNQFIVENDMFKKTLIVLGGVASLMLANSAAIAQNYGNRAWCEDYARRAAYRSADPNAVVGGAVTGAILGGAVGAITGHGLTKSHGALPVAARSFTS